MRRRWGRAGGGRGGTGIVPAHPLVHGIGGRGVGGRVRFPFAFSFVIPLVGIHFLLGQAWAASKGELATGRLAPTADRKTG